MHLFRLLSGWISALLRIDLWTAPMEEIIRTDNSDPRLILHDRIGDILVGARVHGIDVDPAQLLTWPGIGHIRERGP